MDSNKRHFLLKSITDQTQIPRRGAPGVGTVGAWVGQKAESPPHVPPHVLVVILWALRICCASRQVAGDLG